MAALSESQKAPDFELLDEKGRPQRLSQLLESGPVVLFFYPKDETAVCTREACSFRDDYSEFQASGAQIFGISRDSPESHESFQKNHGLPYSLLTDVGGKVAKSYGVAAAFGLLPGRTTFVIDTSGTIALSFTSALQASAHKEAALETVRRLASS